MNPTISAQLDKPTTFKDKMRAVSDEADQRKAAITLDEIRTVIEYGYGTDSTAYGKTKRIREILEDMMVP